MIHCSTNSNQVTDCVCSVLLLLLHLLDLIISIPPICLYKYCSTVTIWFYGHTSAYICSDGPVLFYLPYFYDSTLYSILYSILYITLHAAI